MHLRYIEVNLDEKLVGEALIAKVARPVEDLFLRKLGKVDTSPFGRINIIATDTKTNELGGLQTDVLDCFVYFNFEKFRLISSGFERKKEILNLILKALLYCCDMKSWNKDPFLDAYNQCLKENLQNEWWFKNKIFQSPNKKYYAGLYNIFDLDGYSVELVLLDKNKKQIIRKLVYKDRHISFELDWLKWEGNSESILFKFKPPKKVFEYKVQDLLDNLSIELPERIADIFKG
jgi:hypothetical protein